MAFIKGKNLRIIVGGKPLFHATECSLSITRDLEEIATKDTDGKEQLAGDYSWTMSTSALVNVDAGVTTHTKVETLVDAVLSGDTVTIEFTTDTTGERVYSGSAFVTQADLTAANGSVATGSFSFTGNGDLTAANVA